MLAKIQTNVDKYFLIFQKLVENNLKIQKICQNISKYNLKKCSKNIFYKFYKYFKI